MTRRLALLVVLVGTLVSACGSTGQDPVATEPTGPTGAAADSRLVLVSGRDDHGMLALERVPTYDGIDSGHVVGTVVDGTLARVLDVDGQWLRIETVEGSPVTGWIDDYFLRGEARLVGAPPSCEVRLGGVRRDGGTLVVVRELRDDRVLVETITPPQVSAWARRRDLQELPPQGARCGDLSPGDRHGASGSHAH